MCKPLKNLMAKASLCICYIVTSYLKFKCRLYAMLIYDRVTCRSLSFLLPQFVAVTVEEHSDGSIAFWVLTVASKQNALSSLETQSALRSRMALVCCLSTCYCVGVLQINPLNPELNPIYYLLALLGAHHFLHVNRIRVKLLTFRLLMSYIYIWSTHS